MVGHPARGPVPVPPSVEAGLGPRHLGRTSSTHVHVHHVRMSYVLNSYLLAYLLRTELDTTPSD